MADLAVRVHAERFRPGKIPQDEDLLVAINARRRKSMLARVAWRRDNLTGPPVLKRSSQGEYEGGGLHEEIHKTFHEVSVRVISSTEIETTWPGVAPFITGPTPTTHPVLGHQTHIVLDEYLAARRQSGKRLFRDPVTNEIRWYARERYPSEDALDALWLKLRFGHGWQAGGHLLPDLFPWGKKDCCDHLLLFVDEFDDSLRYEWEGNLSTDSRVFDVSSQKPSLVRTQRSDYRVNWRSLPGMSVLNQVKVVDPFIPFDRRLDHDPLDWTKIVQRKA